MAESLPSLLERLESKMTWDDFVKHAESFQNVGSYFLSAGSLTLSLIALLFSARFFSKTIAETNRLREIEAEQKKTNIVLDLMRIITGVKDLDPEKNPKLHLQIVAIECLQAYPEHVNAYRALRNYYAESHDDASITLKQTTERLIDSVRNKKGI